MHVLMVDISFSYLVATITAGLFSVATYRLLLHPLARFPGPRLAALTRLYEGYYDVYLGGQYTFRIAELHQKYGPIVRISPHEIHVNDPAFFDTLYRQDAHHDKYYWATKAFGVPGATITTADHHQHRARRQPISQYFSKSRVTSQQDLIHRHLDKFIERLGRYAQTQASFDFGAATAAFVRDVVNDFILGKSYDSLDAEDFDVAQLNAGQGAGGMWRLSKFVWFVAPTIQRIPPSWMLKVADGPFRDFLSFLEESQQDVRKIRDAAISNADAFSKSRRTLIHDMMDSKLPASEKAWWRVFQDVSVVSGAGFETTASVLRLICFHMYENGGEIARRLRTELTAAGTATDKYVDVKVLEQLPYLNAVILEAMRLSPAIATRMARISKTDIVYKDWNIPAGTPVSMTLLLLHTDENLFPDPHAFKPDRWIESDGTLNRNAVGYAPFSKGTRNCLGMHLAWAEMYVFVASLVQGFEFSFPSATADDFRCVADSFSIETKGKGHLEAVVSVR